MTNKKSLVDIALHKPKRGHFKSAHIIKTYNFWTLQGQL